MPKGVKGFQPGNQLAKLADHSGRKKKRAFEREILNQLFEQDADGRTVLENMVKAQIQKALEGDTPAFRELMERVDGKVAQKVEGTLQHHVFDLTRCTPEQLAKLEETLETAFVIDGTAEEVDEPRQVEDRRGK